MDLPMYAIVGECPVKILSTEDGGFRVLAFDWKTKDFAPDDGYFLKKVLVGQGEVEYLDEKAFEAYVEKLKQGE